MKFVWCFVSSALAVIALNAFAAQPDWGMVKTTYTAGASKLVAKDQGLLEIHLQLNCIEKATDVSTIISVLVDRINQEVKRESGYSLTSTNPEVSVSSKNQYEIKFRKSDVQQLSPSYVDVCSNKAVSVGSTSNSINLTKKSFTASATLKIETQSSLAGLTGLRQKLQQFAEDLNKEDRKKQVSVGTESFVVSAKKRKEVIASLNDQSRLAGNSGLDTRMKLDQALSGGFSQLYITSVNSETDQAPDYTRYAPVLTTDGKAKVTVPYTFSVQYTPKNIVAKQRSHYTSQDHGEISQQINGEVVVDTDYYVAKLNFSTVCQPTEKAAMEALVAPFEQFRKLANTVVKVSKNNPYERLEDNIGSPTNDGLWQAWEREISNSPQPYGGNTIVKSYISLCDGHTTSEVKNESFTYSTTNSITVVTNNFSGLKTLADAANSFTQAQRNAGDSKYVEVQLLNITPKLKDAKQFEVVDVLAYRSALKQFIDPQGEVAKKLLDEIQAGEAYYTATRGYTYTTRGAPAAAGARSAALGAPAPTERAYDVINTSDGDIPLSEIRVNNTYSVVYRPNKNLIQVLNEARSGADALKITPRP